MPEYRVNIAIRKIARLMWIIEHDDDPRKRSEAEVAVGPALTEAAMLMGVSKDKIAQIIEQTLLVS